MGEFWILLLAVIVPVVALDVAGRPGWPYALTACVAAMLGSLPWLLVGGGPAVALSFGGGPVLAGFVVLSSSTLRAHPFAAWCLGVVAVLSATVIAAGVGVGYGYLTP